MIRRDTFRQTVNQKDLVTIVTVMIRRHIQTNCVNQKDLVTIVTVMIRRDTFRQTVLIRKI